MNTILKFAIWAGTSSVLSAAPATWYLNNVTFTDGGRAVGSFAFDSVTSTFSAVNIQTTPGPSTTSASSAIGGGNYTSQFVPSPTSPLAFVSGGTATNVRRLQILSALGLLSSSGNSIAVSGTEGFCDVATCTNLVGSQSRSIATGQLVRASSGAPATWYLIATMDDGSQAIGSFDFDPASGTYSNVDVAVTGGS